MVHPGPWKEANTRNHKELKKNAKEEETRKKTLLPRRRGVTQKPEIIRNSYSIE